MHPDIKLLTVSHALWGVGEGLLLTLQPLHIQELGANPGQVGGVLSVLSLACALTYIRCGVLSDRPPRKPVMIGAWVCGPVGVLICVLAPGVAGAALAYVLRGGYLACWPLMQAKAGRLLGEANQGLALGTALMAMSGAQVLASVSAGLLYGIQPRWPFLAALAAIPVGLCLVARMTEGERALGPATSDAGR